ncbi:MAG: hypothetical protein IJZ29_04800 [Clostridia bacterium]|nr:hypothetical protein [Clostridia bacterium]
MVKNLYFKIIAVVLMLLATSLVAINFNDNKVLASTNSNESFINTNTTYNYIDKPSHLTGNATTFYVTDNSGKLYLFANGKLTFTEQTFNNLVDIVFVPTYSKIFAIDGDNKIEISADNHSRLSTEQITNATALDSNGVYFSISTKNTITISLEDSTTTISQYYIDDYNTSNFNNIKDICIYENAIYVLDANELTSRVSLIKVSLNDNLVESKAEQVKQISVNTKNDFEMNASSSGIIIREETTLKLYGFDGTYQANLLNEYTHFERSFEKGEVVQCSGIIVSENTIIVADKFSNSVQSFTLSNQSLTFKSLLIASSGSDNDRLFSATNLTLIGENQMVISDYGNRRLVYNDENNNSTLLNLNGNPSLITSSNTSEVYVYARPTLYHYADILSTPTSTTLDNLNVVDMQISALNNLYLLDSNTKSIVLYGKTSTTTIATINEMTAQSKLNIDASGKLAYVLASNNIYSVDLETNATNKIITSTNNIIDFAIDYKGNLYLLTKNSSNTLQIDKYENNTLSESKALNGLNYINLELNLNTGIFYSIDSLNSAVTKISFDNFTNNLISFVNDTSFINAPTSNEIVKIAKIKSATSGYKYPFMISPIMQFEENELVIVLEQNCQANSKFSYCLIANKSSYNELVYISNDCLDFNVQDITPAFEQIKVVTAYAYIYKLPTSLSFENGDNLKLSNYALQNDLFDVVGYACNYKDNANSGYYCIRLEDGSLGYMKLFNAMNSTLDVYQETFQPNAHLSLVLESDKIEIFTKNGEIYEETGTYLADNTKIFVLSSDYNIENEYTKIVYENENHEQISCYVETKFVVLETITHHIQLGIILFFISIALIVIVAIFITKFIKQRKLEERLSTIENE